MIKANKAITLIALIITIIVLLILAGVTINMVLGENGLFNKSKTSVGKYENAQSDENQLIENIIKYIDKINEDKSPIKQFVPEASSTLTSITITGETSNDNNAIEKYYYSIDDGITWEPNEGTSNTSYTFENLNGGTKYYVRMKAVDNAGNERITEKIEKATLEKEGLLSYISKIQESGVKSITITGKKADNTTDTVTYSMNVIYINGDVVLDGENTIAGVTPVLISEKQTYEFGNAEQDVGTENGYASNMVVLKVNGNLTINENVVLTACKSAAGYGGPKGMMIFCTGTLTNNGTISMTARGAKAIGENVFLWENENGSFEYVPAVGGTGGSAVLASSSNYSYNYGGGVTYTWGQKGADGNNRQTGGGGSGVARCNYNDGGTGYSGAGGNGTSYSGRSRRRRHII